MPRRATLAVEPKALRQNGRKAATVEEVLRQEIKEDTLGAGLSSISGGSTSSHPVTRTSPSNSFLANVQAMSEIRSAKSVNDSLVVSFGQVSMETVQARGRFFATRDLLEEVRIARLQPAIDSGFSRNLETVKVEVGAMIDELRADIRCMEEVAMETRCLSDEVDSLVDNDARMAALLERMNQKVDVLKQTVGNY
jgi:hypothetical protein